MEDRVLRELPPLLDSDFILAIMMLSSVANAENISIDNSPLSFEGKSFSGEYLMQNGLEIPYGNNAPLGKANEWASRVLLIEVTVVIGLLVEILNISYILQVPFPLPFVHILLFRCHAQSQSVRRHQ